MEKNKRLSVNVIILFLISILFLILYIKFSNTAVFTEENVVKVMVNDANKVLVPKATDKALLNYKIIKCFWVLDLIWSIALPIMFIATGFSERVSDFSKRVGKKFFFSIIIYFAVSYTLYFIAYTPLVFFGGYFRTHLLGLSTQSFLMWITTKLKGYALNLLIGIAIVWIPYGIMKKSPKRWWLYIGLLALPYIITTTLLSPVFIDPIYNKFSSISDKTLEQKILTLAEKSGIKDAKLYVVDKSKETKTMNAYMTGIFNTKRIVIWDTTLTGLNEREVLVVVAHEIGHYVLGHIPKSIAIGFLGILLVLYLVNRTCIRIVQRFKGKFGIRNISDMAAIPLILLVINLYTFIASPIENAYSRYIELEADRFAIELTKDNFANATTEVKFLESNLSIPKPGLLFKLWNYDHPTVEERINFSNEYKPWEKNEKLKYEKYIK